MAWAQAQAQAQAQAVVHSVFRRCFFRQPFEFFLWRLIMDDSSTVKSDREDLWECA